MRASYDEAIATGLKRRQEPARIVGDLLTAEVAEKQARSIKYPLSIAKLALAKDLDEFDFTGTPINEGFGPRPGERQVHRQAAQRRADRRHRHGQKPFHHSPRTGLHPRWRERTLLHRGRSREPAGKRGPYRPAGTARRLPDPARLRRARRTRLSAIRPDRRAAALSPDQPPIRVTTNLAFAEWASVFGDAKMTTALLDRLSHPCENLETGQYSRRLQRRA